MNSFNFGLYPVITKEFCRGRNLIDVLHSVIKGGAKIVQLREKNISKKSLYELASEYRSITFKHQVKLIINDHLDIALAVGADGVHLGQDDLPCAIARKIAPHLIIGVSTHNEHEILKAEADGSTYINIGPIFSTNTKKLTVPALGLDYLKKIKTKLPFSVMGGIKTRNIGELLSIGVKNIAMVTEITEAPDIEETVRKLIQLINIG